MTPRPSPPYTHHATGPGIAPAEDGIGEGLTLPGQLRARTLLAALWRRPVLALSIAAVIGIAAFCFLGPVLYRSNVTNANLAQSLLPPQAGHPLGTDEFGYDQLGRLMIGGRTSIEVGVAAALFAAVFGAIWGAIAGLAGGMTDAGLMRLVDAVQSIPTLFVVIVVARIITLNVLSLILLVSYAAWLAPARLVRAETLTMRTRDFVQAVTAMGGGRIRIIVRHVAPNAIGTIMVNMTFQVADAILTVAALGYLGVTLPAPNTDWGSMLSDGVQFAETNRWWLIYPPGLAIVVLVVTLSFIGDNLRDLLDVRSAPAQRRGGAAGGA